MENFKKINTIDWVSEFWNKGLGKTGSIGQFSTSLMKNSNVVIVNDFSFPDSNIIELPLNLFFRNSSYGGDLSPLPIIYPFIAYSENKEFASSFIGKLFRFTKNKFTNQDYWTHSIGKNFIQEEFYSKSNLDFWHDIAKKMMSIDFLYDNKKTSLYLEWINLGKDWKKLYDFVAKNNLHDKYVSFIISNDITKNIRTEVNSLNDEEYNLLEINNNNLRVFTDQEIDYLKGILNKQNKSERTEDWVELFRNNKLDGSFYDISINKIQMILEHFFNKHNIDRLNYFANFDLLSNYTVYSGKYKNHETETISVIKENWQTYNERLGETPKWFIAAFPDVVESELSSFDPYNNPFVSIKDLAILTSFNSIEELLMLKIVTFLQRNIPLECSRNKTIFG